VFSVVGEVLFKGKVWVGNRLYDTDWILGECRSLACLFGKVRLMVWSLGIWVWFGLGYVLRCFGFSTGAGGFCFLVLSFRRRGGAAVGNGIVCLGSTSLVHIPACVRLLVLFLNIR
jgi:hypothetical protein